MSGGRALGLIVILVGLAVGLGCGPHTARTRFPPGFDPELASILRSGEDSLLVRYVYEKGVSRLLRHQLLLRDAIPLDSEAAYDAATERFEPYIRKLLACLADSFHMPGYLNAHLRRLQLGYAGTRRLDRLERIRRALADSVDVPPAARLIQLRELLSQVEALDPICWTAMALDVDMAKVLDEQRDTEGELACYRRALARERAVGDQGDLAWRLGLVGFVLNKLDHPDSAKVYYEQAWEVACRMRRPKEAVFALRMLNTLARSEGRLSQAYELTMESQRIAREFRAEFEEWDALRPAIEFNTDLGAWKIVDDLVLRADQIARDYGPSAPPNLREWMHADLQRIRGMLLIATGKVDEGSSLFAQVRESVRKQIQREHYAMLMTDWGRSLLDAGRGRQALPILEEAREYSTRGNLPSWTIRLDPLCAQARLECGDLNGAEGMLADFRIRADGEVALNRAGWVRHDATAIRLAALRGDPATTERAGWSALARLERILRNLDGSESAYLFLDSCRDLRSALHECLAGDPAAGYGLELYWRSLYRKLGRSRPGSAAPGVVPAGAHTDVPFAAFMTRIADRAERRLEQRGAEHCLYLVAPGGVIRWVADGHGVRRDDLPVESPSLRKVVQGTIGALGQAAASRDLDPELAGALVRLAELLIPPRWGRRDGPPLVLISPDGYLGALPFETLNVAGSGEPYRPLLEGTEVAYLRYDAARPGRAGIEAPGLVVADPVRSPDFQRRYPTLGVLPDAREEAEAVMARSPASTYLYGAEATRPALTRAWESSRFLYIASHFVRDAEVPYLVFLPLAPDTGGEGEVAGSSYLELGEIRNAHLDRCSLVVLSGCASGVPYSDMARSGPGLGDAFLDAGAGAVIQTFWKVDDRESSALMRRWTARWADGATPLEALSEVRREAFHRGTPPQVWAAYGIEFAGL